MLNIQEVRLFDVVAILDPNKPEDKDIDENQREEITYKILITIQIRSSNLIKIWS